MFIIANVMASNRLQIIINYTFSKIINNKLNNSNNK